MHQTMPTTNLMMYSSVSFEALTSGIQIESEKVSVHRQVPFLADAFPDLAIVFPVPAVISDRESLSHPFGTCSCKIMLAGQTHRTELPENTLPLNLYYMPLSFLLPSKIAC